jgi:hypothetical protein
MRLVYGTGVPGPSVSANLSILEGGGGCYSPLYTKRFEVLMTRLLAALVLLTAVPLEAQVQRYEIDTIRARLLEVRDGLPKQNLLIQGEATSIEAAAFITFYADVIHPKLDQLLRLEQRRSALNVLIDTGSYLNKEEHEQWRKEFGELTEQLSAISVDPIYNGEIARWGKMAEGLDGQLAEYAQRFARENALNFFPEEMRGTLTEVALLHQEYKAALIATAAANGMNEWETRITQIPRLYKTGALTFTEAQEQLTEVNTRVGGRYVGFEAAKAKGDVLNKMAVLRTRLAQSKGFRTWSEYQLEASGQGYSPAYRGAINQREFLHKWIAQMRPILGNFIERRARELKVDPTTLRRQHLSLLTLPDLSLAQPYFPSDKLTDIWQETMIESGFKPETLAQIIVDDKERPGLKNPTMAYMAGVVTPQADTRVLDASTLNFLTPTRLRPGLMYIMQTYRGAGLSNLRTAYHEGMGHALEYLLKDKEDLTDEGYGYVEVPSMTAEYFLRDAQMLFEKAIPLNGEKPTVEQFKTWVSNHDKNSGLNLVLRAGSALYDLDLWDYDYTQPNALTYLQRAEQVFAEIETRTGQVPPVESHVPAFFGQVATTHFTSGNVRNIGYSYATLGSEMMAQYISRELQRRTGRADWYRQPGLADLITETWYKVGWKMPFPENIEAITGQKFDMENILADLTKELSCEADLERP